MESRVDTTEFQERYLVSRVQVDPVTDLAFTTAKNASTILSSDSIPESSSVAQTDSI